MNDTVATTPPTGTALIDQVRQAWSDVLDLDGTDQVPDDVNFLEAGGSSLLLIMLWEELEPLTERTLKVSDLFQHSTVRAQAALLADTSGAEEPLTALGARNRGGLLGRARRDQSPSA
ncbi:acyl carrier protein [Streptomyces sp. NPDC055051]|uniref:acyl carrier protein n=1 Tax=Streptomyces sp. NPDC014861 TaxID=3364923 RepID=UPI0036F8B7E8